MRELLLLLLLLLCTPLQLAAKTETKLFDKLKLAHHNTYIHAHTRIYVYIHELIHIHARAHMHTNSARECAWPQAERDSYIIIVIKNAVFVIRTCVLSRKSMLSVTRTVYVSLVNL